MPTTRRHFLAATAATPLLAQTQQRSANDHIQIALIGAGQQGSDDARASIANGAKLIAVADVYEGRLMRAKEVWGSGLFTSRDYREVLARPDVDAVIIGTPDHWHQRISIDAMKAGKDVYCEKPMVQHIDDGQSVVDAQQSTNRVFQVGSQCVSSIVYQKAKDLLMIGAIGEPNMIEAWWDRNSAIGAWQYSIPLDASPATVDWDRFLGRAPKIPFEAIRWARWRNYRDYGTGVAGDLFVHLFSGMHFITGSTGPARVYGTGGLRFWKDGREVPDVMLALCDYPAAGKIPAFNLALRVNFVCGGGGGSGFRIIGSEGVMAVESSGVTVQKRPRESEPGYTIDQMPAAMQQEFLRDYRAKYPLQRPNADALRATDDERFAVPRGYSEHSDHHRNFLESVRTRKPAVEDALFGFRAAAPALLANKSYFEQRAISWDPQTMTSKG